MDQVLYQGWYFTVQQRLGLFEMNFNFIQIYSFFFFFSIEFDRDFDYFAIAGVTKKIKVLSSTVYIVIHELEIMLIYYFFSFTNKVFEYGTVIRDVVDIHYPVNEMVCNSKIRYKMSYHISWV